MNAIDNNLLALSPHDGPAAKLSPDFHRGASRVLGLAIVIGALGIAIAFRYSVIGIATVDANTFVAWYEYIVERGYLAALNRDWRHNLPYYYLLAAGSVLAPGLGPLLTVKAISILFDFALAFFVYKCVALKFRASPRGPVLGVSLPVWAGLATLLAPTVLLNSSTWGQWDAIYTTFLVACLYFLLAGRQAAAFVAFGVAISFKLQAVFFAPLLLWLLMPKLARQGALSLAAIVRSRDVLLMLLVPAVYLVTIIPPWLAGRSLFSLLATYPEQPFYYQELNIGAPTLYVWVSNDLYAWWPLGMLAAPVAALLVARHLYRKQATMTPELTALLATFSVLLMPYLLPKMHERFFFPADVIAIVLAFYRPRLWYVPVIVGSVSLCCYIPYLSKWAPTLPYLPAINERVAPSEWLWASALAMLGMIAALAWQLHLMLANQRRPGPGRLPDDTSG